MKIIKLIGLFWCFLKVLKKNLPSRDISAFRTCDRLSGALLRGSSCSFTEWLQQMHQLDVCSFIKTFTATTPRSTLHSNIILLPCLLFISLDVKRSGIKKSGRNLAVFSNMLSALLLKLWLYEGSLFLLVLLLFQKPFMVLLVACWENFLIQRRVCHCDFFSEPLIQF